MFRNKAKSKELEERLQACGNRLESMESLLLKIISQQTRQGQQPAIAITREIEYRPCYVYGRKAIFHRWANDARPTLPNGETPGENSRYYQFRSTKAIVEYEDGTVGRVWPNEVKFADGGHFQEYMYLPLSSTEEMH